MINKFFFLILLILPCNIIYAQFHAVGIPNDKLSNIKFDGNISEWDWVPKKYYITSDNMNDVVNDSKIEKKKWDCNAFVAWNETKSWIYIVAVVHDNSRSVSYMPPIGFFYQNDCMELVINANNKENNFGMQNGNYFVLKPYFIASEGEGHTFGLDVGPQWVLNKSKYFDFGWKIQGTLTIYEIGLSLWDVINEFGPELSQRHLSFNNKTIGLGFAFNDVDKSGKRIAQWTTLCHPPSWYDQTGELSYFVLDPPSSSTISRDAISEILKP